MPKRRRKGPIYRGVTSERTVRKSVNRALVSSVTLLAILLIGGAAFTYYSDQNISSSAQPSSITLNTTPEFRTIKKTKTPANAAVGVAVESFSSLVKPGEQASISVRTTPGATCKIEVLYDHVPDTDPNLKPQIADGFGTVNWDWTVSPAAPAGMWPINVNCARNTHSGFGQATIDVSP